MTWSYAFALDPHIRFFLGLCSVFKVQCLAILAFVLLPYRVDLYIIPCDLHYVNTFFVTFLTFFSRYTRIRGKTIMLDYRIFWHQNFLKKVRKKLDFLPKNGKFCVKKSLSPEKFSRFFSFSAANFLLVFFRHFSLLSAKT